MLKFNITGSNIIYRTERQDDFLIYDFFSSNLHTSEKVINFYNQLLLIKNQTTSEAICGLNYSIVKLTLADAVFENYEETVYDEYGQKIIPFSVLFSLVEDIYNILNK